MDAPLEAVREISLDASSAHLWQFQCQGCRIIQQDEGKLDYVFYYIIKGEWPAKTFQGIRTYVNKTDKYYRRAGITKEQ